MRAAQNRQAGSAHRPQIRRAVKPEPRTRDARKGKPPAGNAHGSEERVTGQLSFRNCRSPDETCQAHARDGDHRSHQHPRVTDRRDQRIRQLDPVRQTRLQAFSVHHRAAGPAWQRRCARWPARPCLVADAKNQQLDTRRTRRTLATDARGGAARSEAARSFRTHVPVVDPGQPPDQPPRRRVTKLPQGDLHCGGENLLRRQGTATASASRAPLCSYGTSDRAAPARETYDGIKHPGSVSVRLHPPRPTSCPQGTEARQNPISAGRARPETRLRPAAEHQLPGLRQYPVISKGTPETVIRT